MLTETRNLEEFVKLNDNDVHGIIIRYYKNMLRYDVDLEDRVQGYYLSMLHNKTLESYDSSKMKFNSYIQMTIKNFMIAALGNKVLKNVKRYLHTDSLDYVLSEDFTLKDSLFTEEDRSVYDFNAIRDYLIEVDKKAFRKSAIPLFNMFDLYLKSYTSSEIAVMYSQSAATVGLRKRTLRKHLKKFYDL